VNRGSRAVALIVLAALALGCRLGPNYKRPELNSPSQYRFVEGPDEAASLADEAFWQVFDDPALQDLIRESLSNNLDLATATARVEEARAIAGNRQIVSITRRSTPRAAIRSSRRRSTRSRRRTLDGDRDFHNWNAGFSLSWELDIFGRVRRSERGGLRPLPRHRAGDGGASSSRSSATSASTTFLLRQLDRQLEIARETLRLNDETSPTTADRLEGGVSNQLELDQAIANRAITAARSPTSSGQIALVEKAPLGAPRPTRRVRSPRAPSTPRCLHPPSRPGCRRSCSNAARTSCRPSSS
jgi:multidrug efflux system outer membrane protein